MSHEVVEKNIGLMMILIVIVISIGGLVEIVPLFFIKDTTEPVKGMKPYSALRLEGRDVYIREGCYNCHSQMIRPFRDEALRYGHYSLAAESKFDHPFQWGSKRTGPDLARVGKKYSNEWHVQHLIAPRSVVKESIMPNYPWLMEPLQYKNVRDRMRALKMVGVPYSENTAEYEANVERFGEDVDKNLDILKMNYELMKLGEVEINGTTKSNIRELIGTSISTINSIKFKEQFLVDKLYSAIPNIDSWLMFNF